MYIHCTPGTLYSSQEDTEMQDDSVEYSQSAKGRNAGIGKEAIENIDSAHHTLSSESGLKRREEKR